MVSYILNSEIGKEVGHNPHEEATDAFNEALLKFLDRIKG